MIVKTGSHFPSEQLTAGQKQQSRLTQHLVMSAHMQQAIHLLQLPVQELQPFIEEQVVLNPLLELAKHEEEEMPNEDDSDISQTDQEDEISLSDDNLSILQRLEEEWHEHFAQSESMPIQRSSEEEELQTYREQSITTPLSLHDRLLQEAHETFEHTAELEIAETLIGYIDAWGFLHTPLAEICQLHRFSETLVQCVLDVIQTFEPYGIGASSVQESLLIQLRCLGKADSLAYRIIRDHYDHFLHNRIPLIQKSLKCSSEAIQAAVERDIAKLDIHPGTQFSMDPTRTIVPDVTLRQENDLLIVQVERDYVTPLRLNLRYMQMLKDQDVNLETRQFLKHHLFSARWLARNLEQRYSTIERIADALADKQHDFFTQADGQLAPLTMKSLAEELNVHESTIARTVSNKYIATPRGVFPLRTFFTGKYVTEKGEDLSSTTVRQLITALIANEDKQHPLSDEHISHLLKQRGIPCARRTVAKYRTLLNIAATRQRKKFH